MTGTPGVFDGMAMRLPVFEAVQGPVVTTVYDISAARVGAAVASAAKVRTRLSKRIVVPRVDDDSPDYCTMRSKFACHFPQRSRGSPVAVPARPGDAVTAAITPS
jgi:hypothetical protein